MTGGDLDGTGTTTSTEFVQLTGTTPGPDLPLNLLIIVLCHWMTCTTTYLIGGIFSRWILFKSHLLLQYWPQDMDSSLITGRAYHSCTLFKSPQHSHTDMRHCDCHRCSGGNNDGFLASTEFLNLDSSKSWTTAYDPTSRWNRILVVPIGGWNTDIRHQLTNSSSSCNWSLMKPQLSVDKYLTVAMSVIQIVFLSV
jgi:hypothetical protein